MKLSRRKRVEAAADLVAFADVAFLLIIFFILTSTFVRNSGQKLELPSASKDPENVQNEVLTIHLTPERIMLNGEDELAGLQSLREYVSDAQLADRPDEERLVWIESSPGVRCGRYYQVVAAVADAGGILAIFEEESQ